MNLARNLELSAFFFPDRPALRQNGHALTYKELNDQASRVATALIRFGIKPGDHAGLCAPNSIEWITFYFGVLKAGATAVTLSGALTGDELASLVNHARPRIIFTVETKLKDLEKLKGSGRLEWIICPDGDMDMKHLIGTGSGPFKAIDRDRADTAAILYTGGTTGIPKGVMLSHESMVFSSHSIAGYERSTQNDLSVCFLPFNHVFGQIHIMNTSIHCAGCLELLPAFDMDRVLELMEQGRVTKFFAVPTVYIRLLRQKDLEKRLGQLRYCFSAAASLAKEIVREWKERTGITISESYGMTEVMPVTFNHYYPERHVIGSVGHTIPGVEVQIRDFSGNRLEEGLDGEICIRGRNVMNAYFENPEATSDSLSEDGWFRSGDIGYIDPDGYLFIVDRLKDLIITGGENVYPREVEEVLYAWPEVEECAIVGVPDKEWGERICACIVPKAGHALSTAELKDFLKSRLSGFKIPKEFIVKDELPKSPAGKILKREIRKQLLNAGKQ
ncbi:MAG: Long-chain-fatty-acid--CoA ligase [Syntrophorhabdus sp. PtaU1.Bin058]|nr:MAG: Long-chain-fatty-acid--CoA ligase [Syntrophorhabdus sp. PtaU1.Bin058]